MSTHVPFKHTDEDKHNVRFSPYPSSESDSIVEVAGGDVTIQLKKTDFSRKF